MSVSPNRVISTGQCWLLRRQLRGIHRVAGPSSTSIRPHPSTWTAFPPALFGELGPLRAPPLFPKRAMTRQYTARQLSWLHHTCCSFSQLSPSPLLISAQPNHPLSSRNLCKLFLFLVNYLYSWSYIMQIVWMPRHRYYFFYYFGSSNQLRVHFRVLSMISK